MMCFGIPLCYNILAGNRMTVSQLLQLHQERAAIADAEHRVESGAPVGCMPDSLMQKVPVVAHRILLVAQTALGRRNHHWNCRSCRVLGSGGLRGGVDDQPTRGGAVAH